MEGGVALFLLLVLLVIAAIAGIALYVTGGALIAKRDHGKQDVEDDGPRPEHATPTSPTQETVTFAGTEQDRDD